MALLRGMLTFLAEWLSSSQEQVRTDSLRTLAGQPAYDTDALRAGLDRFAFLLHGTSDGEQRFAKEEP